MRNAFFLNPSPGNLFCHLNVVLVFDVFVRSTSAQTFFSSRLVYSSNSLGLIIQMNTKTERRNEDFLCRSCLALASNKTEEISTATKHRAKNLKNPFQLKQISKDSKVTKKGRTKSSTELMLLPREILFIGIMNLEARRAHV